MTELDKKFKRCENGHFFSKDLENCPYCPSNSNKNDNSGGRTEVYGGGSLDNPEKKTEVLKNNGKTQVYTPDEQQINDFKKRQEGNQNSNSNANNVDGRTMIVFDDAQNISSNSNQARRRLVGWIVSHELDVYGLYFCVYEGRNIVGRGANYDITINEPTVSSSTPHATILFKNGNCYLKDEFSTNGTYINGNELIDIPAQLKDGDIIRFGKGKAIFKFKSAI